MIECRFLFEKLGGGGGGVRGNCLQITLELQYTILLMTALMLKHKDSFGKSENLSKIFFAEILVFDHDYEGKSSSSNGLL